MAVTGSNFVRFSRHGLQVIRRIWPSMQDRFEIRRFGLKLRFWDQRHGHTPGHICDHEYESIKALPDSGIFEVRIDDHVGGMNNIRIVLFDPPKSWLPQADQYRPLRVIWIIEVLQKKRNDWTTAEIHRFKTCRTLIQTRFYET